jgi:hypothetical protein
MCDARRDTDYDAWNLRSKPARGRRPYDAWVAS